LTIQVFIAKNTFPNLAIFITGNYFHGMKNNISFLGTVAIKMSPLTQVYPEGVAKEILQNLRQKEAEKR